ncbi:MAG: UTP--glucose-1-phosphate uridylyltransferase [Propionibacteriaceae bacterium]|nr:UTP--glucose-1-phosphate uridylyltransferase [Propionibacteriaceae bacterium]
MVVHQEQSPEGKIQAIEKMVQRGVSPSAIAIFAYNWDQLASGATGMIPESTITPLANPDSYQGEDTDTRDNREALASTAMIKLNGGLGTTMGLNKAKSLLQVTNTMTFVDLMVRQVLWTRKKYDVRLPLIFLHSFNTQSDVLQGLSVYPELRVGDLPLDMLQSEEPKLLQDNLTPVSWPSNPHLEWCPPGHGDLYPTMLDSGILDQLIDEGFLYANVSNSDNLGASPDLGLAGWFARSGAPFATEITARTPMDLKGGHIAVRRHDNQLILRESAQTPPEEMVSFTDPTIHPHAHCNNLWFDLHALRDKLRATKGVLGLPLIRNAKHVDPHDPASPAVIQIETAMGAAIESFEGAKAIVVPRSRFLPVKSTNELALLRSDAFTLGEDFVPRAQVNPLPVVRLGQAYAALDSFEQRIPSPLFLRHTRSLTVDGDWFFGEGVHIEGDVHLGPEGGRIPDGTILTS